MEKEKEQESIFEQEEYDGGFGSGPLTDAPDPDEDAEEPATEDMGDDEEA